MAKFPGGALAGAITGYLNERLGGLFEPSSQQIESALKDIRKPTVFSKVYQSYVGGLTNKSLGYFLSRELARHLGHRFQTANQKRQFESALRTLCHESSEVVKKYGAEWFAKHLKEEGGDICANPPRVSAGMGCKKCAPNCIRGQRKMETKLAFYCGGLQSGPLPDGWNTKGLNLWPKAGRTNVHLEVTQLYDKFWQNIPARYVDFLEIAAYVFTGDQSIRRVSKNDVDNMSEKWRRTFHYHIPVRELEFWETPEVKQTLRRTLEFLAEDYFDFSFLWAGQRARSANLPRH